MLKTLGLLPVLDLRSRQALRQVKKRFLEDLVLARLLVQFVTKALEFDLLFLNCFWRVGVPLEGATVANHRVVLALHQHE